MSLEKLVTSNKTLVEALVDLSPFIDQMNLGQDLQNPAVVLQVIRLADIVGFMPGVGHVDASGEIAYLHYQINDVHYYITSRDSGKLQKRAFGMIVRGERVPEVDFISIHELVRAGAKLDLAWQPIPLNQVPVAVLS